jgi:hypothetical protein
MWFGEAVSFFLPKERLLRFSHASRAEEIGANAVFIELYRDIMDYDSPQSREAQGAFLYWIRCDAMEKFLMKVNPLKGGAIEVDGTECVHGGTRKFIRWVDDKGEPTGEAKADQKFVWETNDEGYYVWRKRKFLNWEH